MTLLLFAIFIYFNLFYLMARLKKDFSVIDIAWGPSFLLIYLVSAYGAGWNASTRAMVLGILILIWATRLSGYILMRSLKVGQEDFRYAQWRKDWGKSANVIAYFKVYMLQAVLALLMASPLYFYHQYAEQSSFGTVLDILGVGLWLTGFLWESIADYQKNKFKQMRGNKSKILTSGLWKYSRHPNYFGEALLWWGIFLIILNQVPLYLAVVGPALLTFFLLKVSGVSLLEKKYESNTEYDAYKRKTSAFIPWFPKEGV